MEKTKIEWCDSTWSPVTGCYHGCEYCYARRTATRFKGCDGDQNNLKAGEISALKERRKVTTKSGDIINAAYPNGFMPTLHEYRLNDLSVKKFGKNIFVCSMADLFGSWVPDEWILKVFEACKKSPDHRYLFLTKNPARYLDLLNKDLLPRLDNFWYGSTDTTPDDPFFYSETHNTFISFEPILESFNFESGEMLKYVGWAIIGAETGRRKEKVIPKKSWVEPIVNAFKKNGKPVFMKDSMIDVWGKDIITQFPWDSENERVTE